MSGYKEFAVSLDSVRTLVIPSNLADVLSDHLARFTGPEPNASLFPGEDGHPVSPRTLDRVWAMARATVGRRDLRFHDLAAHRPNPGGGQWRHDGGADAPSRPQESGRGASLPALDQGA